MAKNSQEKHSLDELDIPKWAQEAEEEGSYKGYWRKIFGKPRPKYEDYFTSLLRARYMDLEGNLRTIPPVYTNMNDEDKHLNERELRSYLITLLKASKTILEKKRLSKRDLLLASSLLDEADECLVWITPPAIALAQIPTLYSQISNSDINCRNVYLSMLDDCQAKLKSFNSKAESIDDTEEDHYRACIEECIRVLNASILNNRINTGLQIERLRSLRFWGIILLIFYITIFPMVSSPAAWGPYINTTNQWEHIINDSDNTSWLYDLGPWIYPIGAWLTALSFCIIGGIGGFLSGLLQVRSSKTDLGLYEESVLLFQIRPIFGAFAGLVIFMLLSWGLLQDVINTSESAFALVAFVSGFSERYFLRLLKLDEKSENGTEDILCQKQGLEVKPG
jgi:hypothetical protein